MYNHASMCTGIGIFDLAAHMLGMPTIFQSEINPYGRHVLQYYFPNATLYGDARAIDGSPYRGRVFCFTGGIPCQPWSHAGKREGEDDPRNLVPTYLRLLQQIRPDTCVVEEVFGFTTWNEGVVFESMQSEMEAIGYAVQSFIIPACGTGAPHQRDRCWIVGLNKDIYECSVDRRIGSDTNSNQFEAGREQHKQQGHTALTDGSIGDDTNAQSNGCHGRIEGYGAQRGGVVSEGVGQGSESCGRSGLAAHTQSIGVEGGGAIGIEESRGHGGERIPWRNYTGTDWGKWPTVSPLRHVNAWPSDLISDTPLLGDFDKRGRPRKFGSSRWHNESLMALGNGIQYEVALNIMKAILEFDKLYRL